MTFEEAEQRLGKIRRLLNEGRMTREQFNSAAAGLRLKGPDGAWWQPDPNTGGWLRWNGAVWEPRPRPSHYAPPATSPHPVHGPQAPSAPQVARPKRSRASKITAFIIGRIFLAILAYGSAWLLHTWLLVYANDGYNYDTKISGWINVSGNSTSAFTIWFFVFGFFWSFMAGLFTVGPVRAVQALFSAPARLVQVLKTSFPVGLASFTVGIGIMLLVAGNMNLSSNASLAGGVLWFFLGAGYPGLVLANGIRKCVNGFRMDKTKPSLFDLDVSHGLVIGFSIGLILSMVVKGGGALALGALMVIAGITLMIGFAVARPRIPQVAIFLLTGLIAAAVFTLIDLLLPHEANADDGGWKEFKDNNPNGTLNDWLKDDASKQAMEHSKSPAAGAGAGAFMPGHTKRDLPPDPQGVLEQASRTLLDHIRNGGQLPEFPIMTAGFGGVAAAASPPPPTLKQITERLNEAIKSFSGKDTGPVKWPNISKLTGKGRWTRAIIIGLIAASLPWAAGLSAAWILGTGAAAALADKFGPDATSITEMFVGTSDD